jgi:hypothetical protein
MKLLSQSVCTLFLTSQLLAASVSFADDKWNDANDPLKFDPSYIVNYDQLQIYFGTMAEKNRGWADTYWPADIGYIADRWQVDVRDPDVKYDKTFKDDVSPDYNYLMALSDDDRSHTIDMLSPAEKFDLARGATDYPMTTDLRKNAKVSAADWHGVCNGWSQASMNVDEPHPIVYENKALGLKIPFGSGDIKGLLAYYFANFDASPTKSLGIDCKRTFGFGNGGCGDNDVNAGAFHILMVNELGIRHHGFTADSDPSSQVWNQPYTQYTIDPSTIKTYTGDAMYHAPDGTAQQKQITAMVTYTEEIYIPHRDANGKIRQVYNKQTQQFEDEAYDMGIPVPMYQPVLGTAIQKAATYVATYEYILDLDPYDNIIGGRWLSAAHPDLVWKQQYNAPSGDFQLLNDIVAQATAYAKSPVPSK